VLREEVERMRDRLEVFAPVILHPRRGWLSRLVSFFSFTVF
jgi:hypothetical protein